LPQHTVIRLDAATADWYRVSLPDGTRGFVIARATQAVDAPIRKHQPGKTAVVRHLPTSTATPVTDIGPDTRVAVLGGYEDYLLIRTAEGRQGWIEGRLTND
jgi:peptidoglycan LD-endopeptidase LytH